MPQQQNAQTGPPVDIARGIPEYFNFSRDVLDEWAERDPTLEAMKWVSGTKGTKDISLTYSYFSSQSHRAAHLLNKLGGKPGDRVFIMLNRVPAWWEIASAVIRAGMVLCPCTLLATAKDIEYRLDTSQATMFIGNAESVSSFLGVKNRCSSVRNVIQADGPAVEGTIQYREELKKCPTEAFPTEDTKSSDPCLIYFTSGTNGPPKMVLHSQVTYPLAHQLTGRYWLELRPGSLYWALAEQGWAKAAWSWFATWNCGATLFIEDTKKAFSPLSLLEIIHKYPITVLCAPPTAFRQLTGAASRDYMAKHPPLALERCVGSGEPLNPEAIKVWHQMTGLEIRDGYGQSELILVVANIGQDAIKPGSMGKAMPGVPLQVINDKGQPAADSEEGDIAILSTDTRGQPSPFVCSGYISKDGQVTRKSKRALDVFGNFVGEWYVTGDRAYRDRDGYLWFVGRSDDVINSSGYRIGPFEVESVLKSHPAVVESAVVGVPDAQRGQLVKAFVVLTPEYVSLSSSDLDKLKSELQTHCKSQAAPYKYPRRIEFVSPDWLPKTESGKIRRVALRELDKKTSKL